VIPLVRRKQLESDLAVQAWIVSPVYLSESPPADRFDDRQPAPRGQRAGAVCFGCGWCGSGTGLRLRVRFTDAREDPGRAERRARGIADGGAGIREIAVGRSVNDSAGEIV